MNGRAHRHWFGVPFAVSLIRSSVPPLHRITAPSYLPPMTDVVALAAELLALQSSTGSEGPVVDFVSRWLISRGWNVTTQEVTKGRANVWASRAGGGVTFSTHL